MNPEALKRIALLQSLDAEALTRLAAVLEARTFADGQRVFQEGDPGDAMYFIASGTVRIEKRTGATADAVKTLAVLEPGDYFGEMALFDQQPRSAAAVAAGATELFRLSTASFGVLHGSAGHAGLSVLFAMIRTAGERIRRLNAQVVVYDEIGKAIGEAIFCRNVLMYLETGRRVDVLERMASRLAPDGWLFLDPTEHLGRAVQWFGSGASGVYHRREAPNGKQLLGSLGP